MKGPHRTLPDWTDPPSEISETAHPAGGCSSSDWNPTPASGVTVTVMVNGRDGRYDAGRERRATPAGGGRRAIEANPPTGLETDEPGAPKEAVPENAADSPGSDGVPSSQVIVRTRPPKKIQRIVPSVGE